jgi:tetratricopeptide (TPR) repeat protein
MEPYCKDASEAFQNEDYAKAIETWDKLSKMNPEDRRFSTLIETTKNLITDKTTSELYQHAEKFVRDGDYKSAVNELEKILAVRPFDSKARSLLTTAKSNVVDVRTKKHYDQAEAYMKEKQYDLAIAEWKKVLEIDDTQELASRSIAAAVREKMGGLYAEAKQAYERGDYITSRDYYNKILADNPTDLDVKTIIARLDDVVKVALKIEEKSQAGDMMRRAIANYIAVDGNRKASMAAAWYASQLSQSSLSTAVKDFLERKYASILSTMEGPVGDMNIVDQYLFAALNHIYEGRYDLSVQECTIVVELQPNNVLAWKRLGSAYYAIGKKDKARETWEKALKITPDDGELKQFIRQIK